MLNSIDWIKKRLKLPRDLFSVKKTANLKCEHVVRSRERQIPANVAHRRDDQLRLWRWMGLGRIHSASSWLTKKTTARWIAYYDIHHTDRFLFDYSLTITDTLFYVEDDSTKYKVITEMIIDFLNDENRIQQVERSNSSWIPLSLTCHLQLYIQWWRPSSKILTKSWNSCWHLPTKKIRFERSVE